MHRRRTCPPKSTITVDNKVVVDYGPQNPHREASDIDLREMAARVIQRKSITVRWNPGHRQLSDARDAQQCADILRNNEVDRLAKLATTLPLLIFTPTFPSSISLGGTAVSISPVPDHPGFIGSHGYLCGHAAAKCGSNGFGATSAGKGAPPPPWQNTKVNRELCHDTPGDPTCPVGTRCRLAPGLPSRVSTDVGTMGRSCPAVAHYSLS